ncbi:MAG: Crp/Fnr family transcriptional regulator [Bacteroidota bacterium]|nr:Crp/Fnr family transcriptional regulator [Bacteroidota bacterium]MDP4225203.1 Crp/Fnr family transcriptional regulator [Bacteroidota bacterium]MDP4272852.1 Crp/Fnr family transcriptional regulator [Bacteroidota bacterium]
MNKFFEENTNEIDTITIPFQEVLSKEQKELLLNYSNVVSYKEKDIIFKQNTRTSHIMFVKSGMVKIFKESKNDKIILFNLASEGDYIGIMSVFGNDLFQYSASALTNSKISYIDINAFKSVLDGNGKFASMFIQWISKEGLYILDRLMSQTYKQLPGRIADVLLYFSEKIYQSPVFTLPLTRRELAELAGTTKESFIRTLTEFKNDKIIELKGSEVEIKSMKIIKTLSRLG